MSLRVRASLSSGAVLCVNCGFNLKTGKQLSAVVVETDVEEAEEEVPDDAADAKERG